MSTTVNDSPVEVLHRFYFLLDENRYEDMASLLCDDGTWLRQGKELRGPHAMVEALRLRSPSVRVRHVLTNGFAELLADGEAAVTVYQTVYKDPDRGESKVSVIPGPLLVSVISARLRKSEPGGWRIAHLQSRRQFEFSREA